MKERPWLKRVGIILCLVMAVWIAVIFNNVRRENEMEREALRKLSKEYEETMRPLWKEKAQLEQEIIEQEKLVADEAMSPIMLLCTEPSAQLMNDVYPIADQYNYPAVIVISEDAFIGDEGCLAENDAAFLLDLGWELCIGADAGTDLASLYQRVTDAGLPAPVAVYYPANDVTNEQEEQILTLGIQTVIRYGKKLEERNTEGLWYPAAYGSSESNAKSVFQTMVRNAAPLALTVGYGNSREQFSTTNYSNMLKTINNYEKAGEVEVLRIQDACNMYLNEQSSAFGKPETDAQRRLRELREELAELNEKIWSKEKTEQ